MKSLDIGGGAPSQKFKMNDKEYFLGVSHTRTPYKNFFYVFESQPPFKILEIGDPFTILNDSTVEFASGLVILNETVILSVGIDDCFSIVKKYKLKNILEQLFHGGVAM